MVLVIGVGIDVESWVADSGDSSCNFLLSDPFREFEKLLLIFHILSTTLHLRFFDSIEKKTWSLACEFVGSMGRSAATHPFGFGSKL